MPKRPLLRGLTDKQVKKKMAINRVNAALREGLNSGRLLDNGATAIAAENLKAKITGKKLSPGYDPKETKTLKKIISERKKRASGLIRMHRIAGKKGYGLRKK